jgi:hypothetical protein
MDKILIFAMLFTICVIVRYLFYPILQKRQLNEHCRYNLPPHDARMFAMFQQQHAAQQLVGTVPLRLADKPPVQIEEVDTDDDALPQAHDVVCKIADDVMRVAGEYRAGLQRKKAVYKLLSSRSCSDVEDVYNLVRTDAMLHDPNTHPRILAILHA